MTDSLGFVPVNPAPPGSVRLKVCTYNVLAQHLALTNYFPYAQHNSVRQAKRRPRVLQAILDADADVLFLQEVEQQDIWLVPRLYSVGYSCTFQKKTHNKKDGVLIAWKIAKFRALKVVHQDFESVPDCDPNPSEIEQFKAPQHTGGVALSVALQSVEDPNVVVGAGTSHIWWMHEMKRVKNTQIISMVNLIERTLRAAVEENFADDSAVKCALLIGADFNTDPTDEPYQIATSLCDYVSLADMIPAAARGCGFTNVTESFKGWLDHIMWKPLCLKEGLSSPKILLETVKALPSLEEVTREVALPDSTHGSDHIPLICTLAIDTHV